MCLMMGFDSSASLTKVFDLYFLPLMVDCTNVLAVEKCIYQKKFLRIVGWELTWSISNHHKWCV